MDGTAKHIEEVSRWVDENVVSYPTPRAVTLSEFEVDWEQMSGRFYVSLDGQRIEDPFRLSLEQNGWVQFHPPMFTSPLGAPASYRAVDLTADTLETLTKALRSIFPRLKPMGVDMLTGGVIGQGTPVQNRVADQGEFDVARSRIDAAEFSITCMTFGSV